MADLPFKCMLCTDGWRNGFASFSELNYVSFVFMAAEITFTRTKVRRSVGVKPNHSRNAIKPEVTRVNVFTLPQKLIVTTP